MSAAWLQQAIALMRQGRVEEASQRLDEQLAIHPKDFEALNYLCVVRTMQGDFAGARKVADQALAMRSGLVDTRLNRAHLMLLESDFKNGFAEHEWRLRRRDYRQKFHVPRWQGEALPGGAIQIWAEQGLGDALQFIRYMPMVKERVGRVLVKCPQPLRRLFATVPGVDQVIMPRTAISYDAHAPLMSMPYIFETEPDNVPAAVPYIPLPVPMEIGEASGLKVGLVWAGNPEHARDFRRSRELSEFAPLAEVENVTFYGLQFGDAASQARPTGLEMIDLAPGIEDFLDTASALVALDLLITVDTSIAHLAGAPGIPVWIIIDKTPDWRWQLNRVDSPWYPTARLFRSDGDYEALFQRLAMALGEFATKK